MSNPFLRTPEPAEPAPPVATVTPIGSARHRAYCAAALDAAEARVAATPAGDTGKEGAGRNGAVNATTYSLARLLHTGGITEGDIRAAMTRASTANGYYGETGERSFTKILDSAIVAGRGNPRDIPDRPRDDEDWAWITEGGDNAGNTATAPPAPPTDLPPAIPAAVWDSHPWLQHIRQAAHSRMLAADGVLGAVLARASLTIDHGVLLPALPRYGTPNLFCALVGHSGDGKGSSMDLAAELIPNTDHHCMCGSHDDHVTVPAGTGEGIVKSFFRQVVNPRTDKRELTRDLRNICIRIDEGEALTALAGRNGATIATILRQGWSGERLGFAYASDDKGLHVNALTYRLAVVMGIQPDLAGPLFADAAGGTPQRFLWFSLVDPHLPAPDQLPPWPGPLPDIRAVDDGDPWVSIFGAQGRPIGIDDHLRRQIVARQHARRSGADRGEALDSHRDLSRLKVAAVLAAATGLRHIGDTEWDTAGAILDTSDAVRQWCQDRVRRAEAMAAKQRTESQAFARARGIEVARERETEATDRAAAAVARHVAKHCRETGGEPCRRKCIRSAVTSSLRPWFDLGIAAALDAEWVSEIGPGEWFPGAVDVDGEA